ncbi:PREDICTED: FAST kinase domain-containing protein 2, mitochondrial, partial [Nanorana parkeri]|uniref:FAST kinase domain-containing protein 2, mitochondrial n=1 Tax=Nanorana parkeri TaxID=125878 RepID=UPI000854C074
VRIPPLSGCPGQFLENKLPGPLHRKDELFEGVQKLWHTFLVLNQKRKPIERDFIVDHPHFRHLTHGIWKMAPVFSPGALVRTLEVFVHLKLNQKSKLIQSLLLLCQENLSSLNEEEIVILANALEYLRSDRNVDLLKSGLRLLMAVKIEVVNEVTPLLTMMKVLGRNAPLKIRLKLEDKALQMVDKFNIAQSKNLFCVLADIDFYSEHLLNACSQKLIDGIDELSYTNIISILSCCCEMEYSNERLMTIVGDQILKTICLWKPWQLALILQYFTYLRFRHTLLLDRYAAIFTNNLNSVKLRDLLEAVKIYSMLNHLPEDKTQQFLEAVNTSLEAHLDSIPPRNLLFTVFNLCILGVYPDFAINKLLQYKNILTHKEHPILAHINVCLMIDGSFLNRQSLLGMKKIPATTCEDIRNFHIEMENFINDPDLYYHSVKIANTYYIDFILALDTQENKLVPVGDMHADSLQITDSSENIVRIAVLCCTPNAFAMGTLHPLGKLALKIRNLKSLGFSVVLVPMHRMMRMTEEKRVEFMKTIIFEELSDDPNALECRWAKEELQQSPQDT